MLQYSAGNNIRQMADERRTIRRKLGMFGLLTLACGFVTYLLLPGMTGLPIMLLGIWVVDHYYIGWMDFVFRCEQDALRGAKAEESVGAILDRLPDCVVLHGVRKKFGDKECGDIDHVVFRKDGAVLLIETKSHRGTVTEESASNFLKQTHGNIYWLSDFLKSRLNFKPWIHAAIVFPNANVRVRRQLRGVDVVGTNYLERWISKARGNPQVAGMLWREMDRIQAALRGQ